MSETCSPTEDPELMIKIEESLDIPTDEIIIEDIKIEESITATESTPKPNYHPRISEMVNIAIKALCEKNGSSLQAIKKYMVEKYKIDVEKQNTFIKKYLKSAVEAGFLIRTRGRGAAGSFKIPRHEIDPLKAVVKSKPRTRRAPVAKSSAGENPSQSRAETEASGQSKIKGKKAVGKVKTAKANEAQKK